MKIASLLVLAVVAFGVAACSSPSTHWAKGGATPEDLRLDQDECSARGQSYDFAFEDRDSGRPGIVESGVDSRSRRAGSVPGDVYRSCMEARGWKRERSQPR